MQDFARYIPHTEEEDCWEMLETISVKTTEDLFEPVPDQVPAQQTSAPSSRLSLNPIFLRHMHGLQSPVVSGERWE